MKRAGLTDVVTAGFKSAEQIGPRGQAAPKKMREWALSNEGIDLSGHRSQRVTDEMLKAARIILYMDSGQSSKLEKIWEDRGMLANQELGPLYPRMRPLAAYLITPLGKIGDPMFQRPETTEFLTICGQLVEASTRFAQDWLASSMAAVPAPAVEGWHDGRATEITALGTHGLALEAQAAAEDAA
jgi:protein-tyrosine-phosphatase